MLEIKNIKIYDLEESVIACRNAMRLTPPEYTSEEFEKSLDRAMKLVLASKNGTVKCHDNFLVGIRVSFDIIYPQYWTPEFQRYHFADIVTSSSKMHRLIKMDFEKSCNKYVSRESIDQLKYEVDRYNNILNTEWKEDSYVIFILRNGDRITAKTKNDALYYAYMGCISNCPMGLELFMRVSTNYKQLQTIYFQRKNHKLKEDWQAFCNFIEELPYFKELILGSEGFKTES